MEWLWKMWVFPLQKIYKKYKIIKTHQPAVKRIAFWDGCMDTGNNNGIAVWIDCNEACGQMVLSNICLWLQMGVALNPASELIKQCGAPGLSLGLCGGTARGKEWWLFSSSFRVDHTAGGPRCTDLMANYCLAHTLPDGSERSCWRTPGVSLLCYLCM